MSLAGKSRNELAASLAGADRDALLDLIFSLVTFERLITAREIAEATHCNKRDVLADMKAGRFVDPIFGAGFFCRASNSFRVSVSAANAWRRSFFVRSRRPDPIPPEKNARAVEDWTVRMGDPGPDTDVTGKNVEQRRHLELACESCKTGDL
jgi:hypothetical protein